MKKYLLFLSVAAFLAVPFGCGKTENNTPEEQGKTEEPANTDDPNNNGNTTEPEVEPEDLEDLKIEAVPTADCIWSGKPEIVIRVENPNKVAVTADAMTRIYTDKQKQVGDPINVSREIAAGATVDLVLSPSENLEPGFYSAKNFVNKKQAGHFNFGIDPFDIVSAPDMQEDFEEFWAAAKAQLPPIDEENVNMIEMTGKSTQYRKVYLVELKSVPDGPSGEPVTVRGYYCEPQDGKPHPVLMHFYGYDTQGSKTKPDCPGGGSSYDFAEFYLSHRGQYINNRPASSREPDGLGDLENIYGDWFAYNFGDKDSYYYRGAFMDCVQAVNFLASRETSDMDNLFGWGSSQGGALSYAAAALSDYPFRAIAPCVAFLGDFPDYFVITGWPASTAKEQQKAKGLSDEEMYTFLSYFDTKNLATLIPASTAVMGCSGLMDTTCPPHTNIAPFNNLKTTDKEYYFYPKMTHQIPSNWPGKYMKFFKDRIQ